MKVMSLEAFKRVSRLLQYHARANQNVISRATLDAAKLHVVYGVPVSQCAQFAGVSREVVYRAVRKALDLVGADNIIEIGDAVARAKLFDSAVEVFAYNRKTNKTADAAKLVYVYNVPLAEALCFVGSRETAKKNVEAFIDRVKRVYEIASAE